MKELFKLICRSILFMVVTGSAFALSQHEKAWFAINTNDSFSQDKKWLYLFNSQLRLINESHPLQTGIIEGALGYQLYPNKSIWFGYHWAGSRPNDGFYQLNRLYQQWVWQIRRDETLAITSRSRLEENYFSNNSPVSFRIRQRLALEIIKQYFGTINPYFFDEVFIPLNKTHYTSHSFISQNRLFLGFNYYLTKSTWWGIGYINQYETHTPSRPENQMNHIASFTYNF